MYTCLCTFVLVFIILYISALRAAAAAGLGDEEDYRCLSGCGYKSFEDLMVSKCLVKCHCMEVLFLLRLPLLLFVFLWGGYLLRLGVDP